MVSSNLHSIHLYIYIYNSVELDLSVHKLLLQLACDRCETPGYYGVPHGGSRSGVDRFQVATPQECATRFHSGTEKDAMFFIRLQIVYMRLRTFDA